MAEFVSNYVIAENSGSIAFQGNVDDTITDNVTPDDGTFNFGETWFADGGAELLGDFLGSIDVNGETLYVFSLGPLTSYVGSVSDPTTFTVSQIELDAAKSGINVSNQPVCFAAGTLIATVNGPVRVEDLRIGEVLQTAEGGRTKVKWLGRQTLHSVFTPRQRFEPVRVAAGALGGGLPVRDLVLTADHALLLDGLLVQACALVNGTTVARVPAAELPDRVTYYHVETEGHDVILAEGAPAETFVDNVTRRAFDNYAEYAALYGDDAEQIFELDTPRVMSARQLPASLRARMAAQTAA